MNSLVTRHSLLIAAVALAAACAGAAGFRTAPVADYKEGNWSFGASAGTAFVGGEAHEHVFSPKANSHEYATEVGLPDDGKRHQLSRLDWDIAATMIGFSGSARNGRLSLNLGVWYGCSGTDDLDMNDYDWMDGDFTDHSHRSLSEVELTDAWMFDASLSYDFWRGDAFTGYAFAGLREQRWKWMQDGFSEYWYPLDEGGHCTDDGHGIDYRQVVIFGYVGLGGTWSLSDTLEFSAYASWAPRYKGRDRDNHISADKYFTEHFDYDDGEVYAAGIELAWRVTDPLKLTLCVDWQKATLHEGTINSWDLDTDETERTVDGAGYENEYVAFSIGASYTF